MIYEKISLFGKGKSRGTFDDFFSTQKYANLQEAYDHNDYVEGDFVKDEKGTLYIELKNVQSPDNKQYHELNIQHPVAGLDVLDDQLACEMAQKLV
jgi:hypothetical protein